MTLVRGVPARVARSLSDEEVQAQRARALEYVETSRHYARKSASVSRSRRRGRRGRTPPRRPRRGEKRALQRQRILDAARGVFFRDGFMAANLDEVAAGAGVAKGTLYRYFENKAELYVAVLSANGDVFERKMRESIEPSLSPAEQVRQPRPLLHRPLDGAPGILPDLLGARERTGDRRAAGAVVGQVTALWEQCLQLLSSALERGVREGDFVAHDSWEVANILWTLANGLIQREAALAPRSLRRKPLEEIFEDGVDLVLRGLAPAPPR